MSREESYPLSPMQECLLFLAAREPGEGLYLRQWEFVLEGADAEVLARAWQRVVERHELLRAHVRAAPGEEPALVVLPHAALPVQREEWRGLSEPERRERREAYLAADRQRGLELAAAPLARLLLARVAEESVAVVWSHHLLSMDDVSARRVLREVLEIHEALRRGEEPRLEPVRPYREFIEWLQRKDVAEAETWWRKRLRGFSAPTPLSVEWPVAAGARPGACGEQVARLPPGAVEALRALARRGELALSTLAEGAWAVLLSRYSREPDVLFGVMAPGRPAELPGADARVGALFNVLPRRVEVPPEEPVLPWLVRLQAQRHESARFAHLSPSRMRALSEVKPGTPLFQTAFVSQREPGEELGLRLRDSRLLERTELALTALLTEGAEATLSIRYDVARFDEATISRMLGHWQRLLEAMAREPGQRLGDLSMLTEEERHQLVVAPYVGAKEYVQAECLHELFQRQARRAPGAVAVVLEGASLTYGELERRGNQLAHHLRGLGVGPNVLVGLHVERSLELIVGMLGILKAGGAYLPLDHNTPAERVAFIVEDAKAPVLLSQQALVDRLPASAAKVVHLDTDWESIARQPEECPASGARPADLAYVIYTSGSTGRPKGVMINHEHVGRLFAATEEWFRFNERDVWTLFHSSAFDFSVWEIWGALLHGGRLVIVPYLVSRSPEEFHALLCREQVTVLNQTPSAFRQLSKADEAAPPGARLALRYVIFGGEALELESLRPWFERHGGESPRLINMYGITETTVHVTYRPLGVEDLALRSSVIGQPIPDLRLYLLDEQGQPVPVGVPGEIYVGGAGVAREYLARPELSAQRFVADPFSSLPAARMYRSGDLARWRADGDLEYLGRMDFQVKIRGFRIELGEIEAAIQQHPGVREVVVLAREDTPGERWLVAYVVPRARSGTLEAELRSALAERLPEYMVPQAFMLLEALPLTGNGKVDRKALPAPQRRADKGSVRQVPRGPVEETLAGIWADVLGVTRVEPGDGFFALGGSSLQALRAVALAEAILGVQVGVRALFEEPSLAAFASQVERALQAREEGSSRAAPGEAGGAQAGSSVKATLVEIWRELLQVEDIGDGDSFFALGGHSTVLIEALYRIEMRLGVKLKFREFFMSPTLAGLATLIEQRMAEAGGRQYAFDMRVGDEVATFQLSEEDYQREGIPEGGFNVRVVHG
jgi:amino acid adenylation domain-containing protein